MVVVLPPVVLARETIRIAAGFSYYLVRSVSTDIVESPKLTVPSEDHEERYASYVKGMIVTNFGKLTRVAYEQPSLKMSEDTT